MTKAQLLKHIKDHAKSYAHCANIQMTSNRLIIVNRFSQVLHKWVNGKEVLKIEMIHYKDVKELLNSL